MDDEPVVRSKKAPPKKAKNTPKKKTGRVNGEATTSKKNDEDDDMGDLEDPQQWAGDYDDVDLLNLEVPAPPQPCMESDGTGARLVIKEIIATNFKSYYGSQRIGPFHKNFTAIIGPNGSGKSNVIDSLLFVFGFRAQKIRLTNLAELIHNSSNKERPRFCTVEVRFHKIVDMPDGEFESVPGSTFSVSRTAFIEGGSQYQIDGKVKTVKEVVRKLRDVGIDLIHNRFLILQGEVESIAMMKPVREGKEEGMLEYLEDIIGSSRFKEPIERIGKKLEYLSVQRSQQTQKVSMVDKERAAMEGPVQEMIAHLRTENNITSIKNKINHMKMYKVEDTIEELKPKTDKLLVDKDVIETKLTEVLEKKQEQDKVFQEFDEEKAQLDHRLKLITNSLTDAAAADAKRKLDLKRCTKDLITLKSKLSKEHDQMKKIMEIPERAKSQCDVLTGLITEGEEKIKELQSKIDKNRPQFESKSEKLRSEKTSAEEELGECQAVVDGASSSLTIAKEELQSIIAEDEKAKKRIADLENQIEQARNEYDAKMRDQADTAIKVKEFEAELNNTRDTIPKNKEKLNHLKNEISALIGLIANDQELLSENGNSGDRVTSFLEKARSDGNLAGYMGRLCDLAATDAKYDAAFSTTCGTYLSSYLVRSKEDANQAISLIRNAGLPRTNFRILNEIPDSADSMNQPPSRFPLPRLFDQLRISQTEIKKVYYQSVRDSLIVDNMNTARELAKTHNNLYRYVDLNGGVLDQNNTVSGGGKPRKGLITIGNVKPNNVAEVQAAQKRMDSNVRKQADLQQQIDDADSKHRKLEEMLFTVSRNFSGARNHLQSLNNDLNVLKDRISNFEKQHSFQEEQSRNIKVDADLVNEKKATVEKLTEERDEAKEALGKCKKTVDDVSSRLNEMWNTLCGCFASEKDAEMEKLQENRTKLAKEKSSLDTFERQRTKAQSKLDSLGKDIETKEEQEISLMKTEKSMEHELRELEEEKDRIGEDIQLVEDKKKEARSKNSHLDDDEMKYTSALKDVSEELDNLRSEIQAYETELKGIKRTIAGFRLHRIKDVASLPTSVLRPRLYDFMVDDETAEEEAEYNRKQAEREKTKKRKGHDKENDNEVESAGEGENGCEDEGETNDASNDDGILKPISRESLANIKKEDLKFQLKVAEERIAANKKDINMGIIEEYAERVARYNQEYTSLQSIKKIYSDHLAKQEKLKRERAEEFMKGFTDIGSKLKSMYQMITLGGDAALDIKDTMNPFLEGVQFIPTPLYVMDEIDAALDFRNVSIIGHYIKDKTQNAQFIVISLRNNMFELGDRLIGIYKTFDCTKNAVIDPKRIVKEKERITAAMDAVGKKALRDKLMAESKRDELEKTAAIKVSLETLEELPLQSLHNLHLERKRVSSQSEECSTAKRVDDRGSPVPNRSRRRKSKEIEN